MKLYVIGGFSKKICYTCKEKAYWLVAESCDLLKSIVWTGHSSPLDHEISEPIVLDKSPFFLKLCLVMEFYHSKSNPE